MGNCDGELRWGIAVGNCDGIAMELRWELRWGIAMGIAMELRRFISSLYILFICHLIEALPWQCSHSYVQIQNRLQLQSTGGRRERIGSVSFGASSLSDFFFYKFLHT